MNRRLSVSLLLLAALLAGCQAGPTSFGTAPQVEHVVLIWLKQPGNELVKAEMAATSRTLPAQIPGIVAMSIGGPLPSDRDVVDDSFDLALVMRFENAEALHTYETHPVHVDAVKTVLAPNAARIVVYDVMVR
ncbi:MAG: Dabb family protein [Planctomycetes bacterium]|nr:Dabb family protein [Planctomycetota bacterium]